MSLAAALDSSEHEQTHREVANHRDMNTLRPPPRVLVRCFARTDSAVSSSTTLPSAVTAWAVTACSCRWRSLSLPCHCHNGQRRAIVKPTPSSTRSWVKQRCDILVGVAVVVVRGCSWMCVIVCVCGSVVCQRISCVRRHCRVLRERMPVVSHTATIPSTRL